MKNIFLVHYFYIYNKMDLLYKIRLTKILVNSIRDKINEIGSPNYYPILNGELVSSEVISKCKNFLSDLDLIEQRLKYFSQAEAKKTWDGLNQETTNVIFTDQDKEKVDDELQNIRQSLINFKKDTNLNKMESINNLFKQKVEKVEQQEDLYKSQFEVNNQMIMTLLLVILVIITMFLVYYAFFRKTETFKTYYTGDDSYVNPEETNPYKMQKTYEDKLYSTDMRDIINGAKHSNGLFV